jgi:type II secretory pathway pseudopilin PulG
MKVLTSGFTLIETVIYIALLGIIMAGAVTGAYEVMQGSTNISAKTTVQDEGGFVLRKLEWALTGLSGTPTVAGSGCAQTLHTTTYAGTNYDVRLTGSAVEMRENSGSYAPITTSNVSVSCLKFQSLAGTVPGVAATVTISGKDFTTTKYLRQ